MIGDGPDRALHQPRPVREQGLRLTKYLGEKVAALRLNKLGVKLTSLSATRANYLNLPRSGPFEPKHYRY
jgi:S-adenosylhomocysteine hydrolase